MVTFLRVVQCSFHQVSLAWIVGLHNTARARRSQRTRRGRERNETEGEDNSIWAIFTEKFWLKVRPEAEVDPRLVGSRFADGGEREGELNEGVEVLAQRDLRAEAD